VILRYLVHDVNNLNMGSRAVLWLWNFHAIRSGHPVIYTGALVQTHLTSNYVSLGNYIVH